MTQMSRRPGRRLLTALLCAQDAQGEGVCGSLGFAGRRRGPHTAPPANSCVLPAFMYLRGKKGAIGLR